MDFGNKMHEIQEMEGPEKQNGKSLSCEAMEKFDRLFEDDEMPQVDFRMADESEMSFEDAERKYDELMEREDGTSQTDLYGRLGGRFADIRQSGEGEQYEIHHMPADSASNLDRNDGPAIKMEKEDHRKTASCGNSIEAREYRQRQREFIENGKFKEACQMDIDDIKEKFGDKYDNAIAEMNQYIKQLEKEGKIDG